MRVAILCVLAFAAAITTVPAVARITKAPVQVTNQIIKLETVADALNHPWGLAFLPNGQLLVTERSGRMRIISSNGKRSKPLRGVPAVYTSEQGGLLDVVLSPDFATSSMIYFSYSEPLGRGKSRTAVARAKLLMQDDGGRLDAVQIIFRQEPPQASVGGFGSRIQFMPDGSLFITLGERDVREQAQNPATHLGTLVRVLPDGSPHPNNPNVEGWRPEVWSIGHRNVQAIALHPTSGRAWTVEHGARGGDEINLPEAGRNYGWPVITYGRDYDLKKIGEGTKKAGLEQPIYYWDPSIAPSAALFYSGTLFPEWRGNLLVSALAGEAVHRLVLDGDKVVGEEVLLKEFGERLRNVREGPGGVIWLLTDHPRGQLLRMMPASTSRCSTEKEFYIPERKDC
jgi:aldose sugar dehydrogenase